MVTTDPENYVLESMRTFIAAKVTDPVSNRNSAKPFVFIGNMERAQYPCIQITDGGDTEQEEVAAGRALDATYNGVFHNRIIRVMFATSEGEVVGGKSNEQLLRNLSSQLLTAVAKNESDLRAYDIMSATPVGGGQVLGPDASTQDELRQPFLFAVQFLYKYTPA